MLSALRASFNQFLDRHPNLAVFLGLGPKPPEGCFAVFGSFIGVSEVSVMAMNSAVFPGKWHPTPSDCQMDLAAAKKSRVMLPGSEFICQYVHGKWRRVKEK